MPFVKTAVTGEEKQSVTETAASLGIKEAELVRRGLAKMGCAINIEKSIGAPTGNSNNPDGTPHFGKAFTGGKKPS